MRSRWRLPPHAANTISTTFALEGRALMSCVSPCQRASIRAAPLRRLTIVEGQTLVTDALDFRVRVDRPTPLPSDSEWLRLLNAIMGDTDRNTVNERSVEHSARSPAGQNTNFGTRFNIRSSSRRTNAVSSKMDLCFPRDVVPGRRAGCNGPCLPRHILSFYQS